MFFPTIGLAILFFGSAVAAAQSPEYPISLKPTSSNVLGVPAFSYGENVQCDGQGNMFFHAARAVNDIVILKLSKDESTTLYTLPEDEAKKAYFLAFRVTREGHIWVLAHAAPGKDLYLYQFGGNSTGPDKIRISVPEGLRPDNFVMLADDHVALFGYFDDEAPAAQRSKSYFGVFDQSGRLVRDSLSSATHAEIEQVKSHVADAGASQSEDGQTYVLQGESILAVSSTGEMLKKFKVPSPGDGYLASNVFAAGAFLCVKYRKLIANGPFAAEYVLLDRMSGKVLRYYVPNSELGNNLLCFSEEGFTFLRYENHRVRLLFAKP
jgi:hypothetical protein